MSRCNLLNRPSYPLPQICSYFTFGPQASLAGPSIPIHMKRIPTVRRTVGRRRLGTTSNNLPRDTEIPFRLVQLVSPTDNTLSDPQPLSRLLRSYDTTTHTLILVSSEPPIVKLLDKQVEAARSREAEARESIRKRTAAEEKEVQISWGTASGDVQHKVALAKSLLERGDRVKLVFAPRQGGERRDKTTVSDKQGMLNEFEGVLGEVGKKWKEDTIKGKMVACFWEAEGSVKEVVKAKVIEGEVEKRKDKEERRESRRKKDEERRRAAEERKRMGLVD